MKSRITLLLLAGLSSLLVAAGSGPGPGVVNWPDNDRLVVGGYLTDAGAEVLYNLPYLMNPPPMVDYYFSSENGGFADQGADTNPCTEQQPCRSLDKCYELSKYGGVHCYFDDEDDWSAADDWGPSGCDFPGVGTACTTSFSFDAMPQCPLGPRHVCSVWSDWDLNPKTGAPGGSKTRPLIDCATAPVDIDTALFRSTNNQDDDDGWPAFINLETNCPDTADVDGADIFRMDGSAAASPGDRSTILALNIKDHHIHAGATPSSNEFYTSHESSEQFAVLLNSDCVIDDNDAGISHYCLWWTAGSAIVIGKQEMYNAQSVALANGNMLVRTTSVVPYAFIMGHTFSCTPAANTERAFSFENSDAAYPSDLTGGYRWITLVDVFANNCSVAGSHGIFVSENTEIDDGPVDLVLRLFRTTVGRSSQAVSAPSNLHATNSFTGEYNCSMFDDIGSYVGYGGSGTITITAEDNIYDDTEAATSFRYNGNNYTASGDVATGEGWTFNFTDLNGTDPFDGHDATGKCLDTSCQATCPSVFVETFKYGTYIPAEVLGEEIIGVVLNTTANQNIGAR